MKSILLSSVLVSMIASASASECVVKQYRPNGKVIQKLSLDNAWVALVGEPTAEVNITFQDNEFQICVISEASENAVSFCSKGQEPNVIFNGKVISCSL